MLPEPGGRGYGGERAMEIFDKRCASGANEMEPGKVESSCKAS